MTKFLLLLGPSGVGKTTVMQKLREMDARFVYISPYITRKLRTGEFDKVYVSHKKLDTLVADGKILVVNELYGVRYATPKEKIKRAFSAGKFPLLDWPIDRLDVMQMHFPDRLFRVYIRPPSLAVLRERLGQDDRDTNQERLKAATAELKRLRNGEYDHLIDYCVANPTGGSDAVAEAIYERYLAATDKSR